MTMLRPVYLSTKVMLILYRTVRPPFVSTDTYLKGFILRSST